MKIKKENSMRTYYIISMHSYKILSISLSVLTLAACSTNNAPVSPVASTTESSVSATSNLVNPLTIKIGDTIAGLTVTEAGPISGIEGPMSQNNIRVKFSGDVQLKGAYVYEFSDFDGTDRACFDVTDSTEQVKLPSLGDNDHTFCFENIEQAKTAFGPEYTSGNAEITIRNFELQNAPAAVRNIAELVQVVSKN